MGNTKHDELSCCLVQVAWVEDIAAQLELFKLGQYMWVWPAAGHARGHMC